MSSKAVAAYDKYASLARERAKDEELREACKKRAKGGLEEAAPWVAALLEEQGVGRAEALRRALSPDVAYVVEHGPERALKAVFDSMGFEEAKAFCARPGIIEGLPFDSMGFLGMWAFEDGSAWVSYLGGPQQAARATLEAHQFPAPSEIDRLWPVSCGAFGERVGEALRLARERGDAVCALDPKQARALGKGVCAFESQETREGVVWRKGMAFKYLANGNLASPEDFQASFERALDAEMEALKKGAQKRLEEAKREREAKTKVHWRESMCHFLSQASCQPVYDAGLAAFLMSKPACFGQYPASIWSKVFSEVVEIAKALPEGESPEISAVERSAVLLGSDLASQLGHFLYRYHRAGGAKILAKRLMEEKRVAVEQERRAPTGLAALLTPKAAVVSEEAREVGRAAGSVEFSVQYGAALALHTALWAKDSGFEAVEEQARVFVRAMRGADEVSLECFGWFGRLIYELSEGFVSKEAIEGALMGEMESASKAAEAAKIKGGKIAIENEWSGSWSQTLARRKLREYLGLGPQGAQPAR